MNESLLQNGDESPFAKAIRQAIGASDFEQVRLAFPVFDRVDGRTVSQPPPKDPRAWDVLRELPKQWLKDLGLGIWEVVDGVEIWLYPAQWYDHVPEGYEVTGIFGDKELFTHGKTDNDRRFGFLSFGFSRKVRT